MYQNNVNESSECNESNESKQAYNSTEGADWPQHTAATSWPITDLDLFPLLCYVQCMSIWRQSLRLGMVCHHFVVHDLLTTESEKIIKFFFFKKTWRTNKTFKMLYIYIIIFFINKYCIVNQCIWYMEGSEDGEMATSVIFGVGVTIWKV